SPYGNNGTHPTGIRVGGTSRSRSAMKVAEERRFADYRTDRTLDARQMRVALRRLRQLTRTGLATELDLDETVDETCRNAGEIELVFRPPRKNDVRLLLLMDVGGTMDPYVEPMSQLLTALHEERGLRAFEPYYFHNCVYESVYTRARMPRAGGVPPARPPRPPEGALEGRAGGRRDDKPRRAPPAERQHRSPPPLEDTGHRLAPPHRRALRPRRVGESRAHDGVGVRADDEDRPPPLPDVPAHRRRHHGGGAGAGRRAGVTRTGVASGSVARGHCGRHGFRLK